MNFFDFTRIQTRRQFFHYGAGGLETIAVAHLLAGEGRSAARELPKVNPLAPQDPHFSPRAKNVIFLLMAGGPSHIDLYDPKPELQKWHGKPLPESLTKDLKLVLLQPSAKVLGSPRQFTKHGQSGLEFSDYLPNIASRADDIALIRSMHTEAVNHHPAQAMLMSGTTMSGRPTIGSWVSYGLGSESEELPAFVVLSSGRGASAGSANWTSGFLPSTYRGVNLRNTGDPILYLTNPPGISAKSQRARLDAIRELNEARYSDTGDLAIASRIHSYELAFRMQSAGPELLDFSAESQATLDRYGVNQEPTHPYATNCLLARRMVERGVRFVMLVHASWDDHEKIDEQLKKNCDITDKPISALLTDLKHRGLLDDTIVVWGRRVRPYTHGGALPSRRSRRTRPSPQLLHDLGGRGRDRRRPSHRTDRRHRSQHRRGPRPRPRPAGDHSSQPRPRTHQAHLPPHGPRLPPHGRGGQGYREAARVV